MIRKYLNTLRFVWTVALIISVMIIAIACLYAFSPLSKEGNNFFSIHYMYAIQIIVVVIALFINKRYKSKLKDLSTNNDLTNKLSSYFKLNKTIFFSYIGLVVLASLSILFVKSPEAVVVPVILLLLLYLKRPFIIKLKMELSLSDQDMLL